MIESLEKRRLLAAALVVNGSAASDKITLLQVTSAGVAKIRVSNVGTSTIAAQLGTATAVNIGPNTSKEFADVSGITLNGNADADTLKIDASVAQGVTINGGAGNDTITGSTKNDSILGGENDDSIDGAAGDDSVFGQSGNDSIQGNLGNDSLNGDQGRDTVRGGANNDFLVGGSEADSLFGDADSDRIASARDGFRDTVFGGTQTDFADFGVSDPTPDQGSEVENTKCFFSTFNTDGVRLVYIGTDGPDVFTVNAIAGGGVSVFFNGFTDIYTKAQLEQPSGELIVRAIFIHALKGNDRITIGPGVPRTVEAYAGEGNDTISGGGDLNGGAGNDSITGGSTDDHLDGDGFYDLALALPVVITESNAVGNDTLTGGGGKDTVLYSQRTLGVKVSLDNVDNDGRPGESDRIREIENIIGGTGPDSLVGDGGANFISSLGGGDTVIGGDGSDVIFTNGEFANSSETSTIDGGGGSDSITGTYGRDSIVGGTGNDTILGGEESDTISGGDGDDSINAGTGDDRVDGLAGNDTLYGDFGLDTLAGGAGNDKLYGQDQDDNLFGGTDNDTLDGGTGADYLSGQEGGDAAQYDTRTAPVVVDIGPASGAADADDGQSGERDDVRFDVENIVGGSGNDRLTGSSQPNFINGLNGNDSIDGQGGNDILLGGAGTSGGNDTINGGAGNDSIDAGAGNDRITDRDGSRDTITGGDGIDSASADSLDILTSIEFRF